MMKIFGINWAHYGVMTLKYIILFLTALKVSESCLAQFGVDYAGGDLPDAPFPVNSTEDCCQACQNNTDCVYWTFYKDIDGSVLCATKDSSAFAAREWNPDMISGAKEFPTCGPREYDISYREHDIPGHTALNISTADECCSHCSTVADAKGWVHNDKQDKCYCKYELEESVEKGFGNDIVSGLFLEKACGNFSVTTRKVIDQTEVKTVMTITGVNGTAGCAKECVKMMGCRAAEFRATVSLCLFTNYNPDESPSKFRNSSDPGIYLLYI